MVEKSKSLTFEIMLFASSGNDFTLPAPAVCRDVFNTLMEFEQVSDIKRRGREKGIGKRRMM